MMRITLEVRLYEDVLRALHYKYQAAAHLGEGFLRVDEPDAESLQFLIRRLEAGAFEITWNLWRRP